jgi:hypothetical protein
VVAFPTNYIDILPAELESVKQKNKNFAIFRWLFTIIKLGSLGGTPPKFGGK